MHNITHTWSDLTQVSSIKGTSEQANYKLLKGA